MLTRWTEVLVRRIVLSVLLLPLAPWGLSAQERAGGMPWPVATVGVAAEDLVSPAQERRLPVYDDAGEPIPFAEIEARVKSSGSAPLLGFLLGGAAGLVIGAAVAQSDCGQVSGGVRTYCSPREDAMQSTLPLALGTALGALGMWAFHDAREVTWTEALEQIRRERSGVR